MLLGRSRYVAAMLAFVVVRVPGQAFFADDTLYKRTHIPKPPAQPLRLAHIYTPFRNHRSFNGTRSNRG